MSGTGGGGAGPGDAHRGRRTAGGNEVYGPRRWALAGPRTVAAGRSLLPTGMGGVAPYATRARHDISRSEEPLHARH